MKVIAAAVFSTFLIAAFASAEKPASTMPAAKAEPAKAAAASPAAAAFEKIKSLAGTWTWQHDGKSEVALQSRVSSGGTVVIETMFPGTPHEMTNVYTVDGDAILVTHYCAMGNQPRLQARPEASPAVLKFALRDVTNADAKTGSYMGELTLTMVDADHVVHEWRNFAGGKPGDVKRFEFARSK